MPMFKYQVLLLALLSPLHGCPCFSAIPISYLCFPALRPWLGAVVHKEHIG